MNDVTAAEARMPNPLAQALWRLGIKREDGRVEALSQGGT